MLNEILADMKDMLNTLYAYSDNEETVGGKSLDDVEARIGWLEDFCLSKTDCLIREIEMVFNHRYEGRRPMGEVALEVVRSCKDIIGLDMADSIEGVHGVTDLEKQYAEHLLKLREASL